MTGNITDNGIAGIDTTGAAVGGGNTATVMPARAFHDLLMGVSAVDTSTDSYSRMGEVAVSLLRHDFTPQGLAAAVEGAPTETVYCLYHNLVVQLTYNIFAAATRFRATCAGEATDVADSVQGAYHLIVGMQEVVRVSPVLRPVISPIVGRLVAEGLTPENLAEATAGLSDEAAKYLYRRLMIEVGCQIGANA